jgi:hypothetical protein
MFNKAEYIFNDKIQEGKYIIEKSYFYLATLDEGETCFYIDRISANRSDSSITYEHIDARKFARSFGLYALMGKQKKHREFGEELRAKVISLLDKKIVSGLNGLRLAIDYTDRYISIKKGDVSFFEEYAMLHINEAVPQST